MLIVIPSPRVDFLLRVFDRLEPVGVQALLAEATVEAFDDSVVGWSTATAEVDLHLVRVGSQVHLATGEL